MRGDQCGDRLRGSQRACFGRGAGVAAASLAGVSRRRPAPAASAALGEGRSVRPLDGARQPACQPVRDRRPIHDHTLFHTAHRRGAVAGRRLPQLSRGAAAVCVDCGDAGRVGHTAS